MKTGQPYFATEPAAPVPPREVIEVLGWRFEREPGQTYTVEAQPGYWAMRMATASRVVYLEPADILPGLLHEEPGSLVPFDRGSTQAIGYRSEGHLCLVFRGTQERDDFVVDAKVWLQGEPGLHRGFDQEWRRVQADVAQWLAQNATHPLPLAIAGHSLGGALALLAAFHLSAQHPVAGVFTFGAPRAGSAAFAARYGERRSATGLPLKDVTRRFRHAGDPVAVVPPPLIYDHVGIDLALRGEGARAMAGIWHWPGTVPVGLAACQPPPTQPLAGLSDMAVTATRGSLGAQVLALEDWMFAATPMIAVLLALAGLGLLALSQHWRETVEWVAQLGRFGVLQALAAAVCIAALQQLTYLVSGPPAWLRWLVAAGLFAGAWTLGWTALMGAPIVVGLIVLLILVARMLLPYAGDHAMARYEMAFRVFDDRTMLSLNPNLNLFRSLGLNPHTQVMAPPTPGAARALRSPWRR